MGDEVAAFHQAAARRQRRISGIAGVVMLVLGGAVMALALWLDAPDRVVGRKWGSVLGGGLITFWGLRSLVQLARGK
jgi:predicted N-acyltransferase